MEYIKLHECAEYRNERTKQIDYETYITTDNMLPNKGGITIAETLPNSKTISKYIKDDILLSNIRPYFKKIWLSTRTGGCSNDVLVVKAKKGYLPTFLYYVLSDNNFFNYDTTTSKGTKMPELIISPNTHSSTHLLISTQFMKMAVSRSSGILSSMNCVK